MKKYVLYIACDGICDMDETDVDINDSNHITIEGLENAKMKRREINLRNGFDIRDTYDWEKESR